MCRSPFGAPSGPKMLAKARRCWGFIFPTTLAARLAAWLMLQYILFLGAIRRSFLHSADAGSRESSADDQMQPLMPGLPAISAMGDADEDAEKVLAIAWLAAGASGCGQHKGEDGAVVPLSLGSGRARARRVLS